MYSYIAKSVFDDHLGSSNEPCYIQNRVITNCVIKRLKRRSSMVSGLTFASRGTRFMSPWYARKSFVSEHASLHLICRHEHSVDRNVNGRPPV